MIDCELIVDMREIALTLSGENQHEENIVLYSSPVSWRC